MEAGSALRIWIRDRREGNAAIKIKEAFQGKMDGCC